jgi:membrane protease YdiL (CAAX protease family)
VGILEELLFRYIAFDYFFSKSKNYVHSAALVSLLFALFHISNLFSGSSIFSVINQIEVAFLFGLLLQFVFLKTNNLVIVSTIHALINFIGSNTSVDNNTIIEHITFHDFIFNQLLILIIYVIFIPIYNWGLKNHLN